MSEVIPSSKPPGLRALIREDYLANGRDWSLPGFRAVAVYRFGVWRMGIRSRLLRMPFSFIYNRLYRHVRNHYSIELPYTCTIGRRLMIGHQGAIVFHESAVVGDDCLIRHGVTIGASSHRRAHEMPVIGNRVQIGAGAMVLGKITVGDDAMIGANAVVTCDVPAGARAVAAAATIIPAKATRETTPASASTM